MVIFLNIQNVINAATKARENSYAPYSNFRVGAALLTTNGELYAGTNVENVSFGATICAERAALCAAIAAGHREFELLAIISDGAVSPCGICRQMLIEFGDMDIILADPAGHIKSQHKLGDLMPQSFKEF